MAPPCTRTTISASLRSLRSRRMVCGVTTKCAASSSTVTRPFSRSQSTISICRRVGALVDDKLMRAG